MSKAIMTDKPGAPDVLQWQDHDPGRPGAGEVLLRHVAIGVNYIDNYHRSGLYPWPDSARLIPGCEAVGVIEEVGTTAQDSGVGDLAPGDIVGYVFRPGAYCEMRVMPAGRLVKLPPEVAPETAAAAMLKGWTAHYLLHRTYKVQAGDTILFHAAAGGVGTIAGQWARYLGARVIGTVGSDAKAEIARNNGYSDTINYRHEDFAARTRELTGGVGVDVVYDSVGKDSWQGSLACLKPRGLWVSFGMSSGPITDFDLGALARSGSLFATRPSLFDYIATRAELQAAADALFAMIAGGHISVTIHQRFALKDAAEAHRALEGRRTHGAVILVP